VDTWDANVFKKLKKKKCVGQAHTKLLEKIKNYLRWLSIFKFNKKKMILCTYHIKRKRKWCYYFEWVSQMLILKKYKKNVFVRV